VTSPSEPWRRNLAVCVFGSFTTLVAMTLMLPFLPLYVEELGVRGHADIVQWSGVAYGASFLVAALMAPLWGRLGDRFGRKPNLVRASLGMAIVISLMGFCHNIWQLVGLRLLVGVAGGYSSGSTILIAIQTPKARSAWALGILSSGLMAGNLIGPIVGGALPPLIGIRATFMAAGALIFVAFIVTALFLRESFVEPHARESRPHFAWSDVPNKRIVVAMLITGSLLMFANMSIEPIITVYVRTLVRDPHSITFISGLVMSAGALGSIVSAAQIGKIADRIGHARVIVITLTVSALLLIPQAFVTTGWELIGLRFLMGVALGGLLPSVASVIRHNIPDRVAGTILGFSVSAQLAGQVTGPLVGGFIGGQIGMRAVFLGTCVILLAGALFNWRVARARATVS